MKKLLDEFMKSNGYYGVFVPNMKVLSDSYREYAERIEAANGRFLEEFPQAAGILGQE
jgi:hypothetical protein